MGDGPTDYPAHKIDKLQKRIAELEAEIQEQFAHYYEAITAERQRRESAEAALMRENETMFDTPKIWLRRVAHFSKYGERSSPPVPDHNRSDKDAE